MSRQWLCTPLLLAAALGTSLLTPQAGSAQFRGSFNRGLVGFPIYYPGFFPYSYGYQPYTGGYSPWMLAPNYNPWAFAPAYAQPYSAYNQPYYWGNSFPQNNFSTFLNTANRLYAASKPTTSSPPPPPIRGSIREFYNKGSTPVTASDSSRAKDQGAPGNGARITVKVPADAQVWFDGKETEGSGTRRSFDTPSLAKGQKHTYTIRARWSNNGIATTELRRVTVEAGSHQTVDFTKPLEVRGGNARTLPVKK
jgi:uncharacterized protein (TIGR03000 family)